MGLYSRVQQGHSTRTRTPAPEPASAAVGTITNIEHRLLDLKTKPASSPESSQAARFDAPTLCPGIGKQRRGLGFGVIMAMTAAPAAPETPATASAASAYLARIQSCL